MRVGIYLRVSTDEQASEGYSLDNQKERLMAYCLSQGWDDVQVYMDDGFTGTNMNRPGLKRMIRHIEEKFINAVIVLKLDRLSRKQKDALYLLEDVFEKNNVIFKSATEPFDTSTPLGKAMIGVLAVFAQLERDMIVERTTAGRRERVKQGKWYGGPVPFGYLWNKESDMLEVIPEEAALVQEIYTRYLEGQSMLSIGEVIKKKNKSRNFDHSGIRDILERPIYMGKLINGNVLEQGNHEIIIEPEQWYKVQLERERRKDGLPPVGEYLLTGLLKCGVCGGPIVHVKRITNKYGKRYEYELYACKKQHVRYKDRNGSCTLGYSHRTTVESFVIDEIKTLSASPDKIKEKLSQRSSKDNSHLIASIKTKIEVVTAGMDNLYDAIQSGAIKASAVGDRIRKLEEEREALMAQLDDIKDAKPQTNSAHQMSNLIKHVGDSWDKLNEDEQKRIIRKLVAMVILNKDEHEIVWNLVT